MEDSDIQFLGNWNSQQAPTNNAFVSAIVLVPMDGSPSRTFSRIQTSLVNIGRTPTSDALDSTASRSSPEDTAGFTNPVMSRKHAKITFADSGSAFIIDTNSHHGTWVYRPNSTKPSIKLASESPYMLLDGDKVTFGKEVLKNGTNHQPLTVSVKLLRTNTDSSSPAVVADPYTSNASPKPRNRFGLGRSSDSDSSEDESTSETNSTGPSAIRVELPFKISRTGRSKSSDLGSCDLVVSSPSSKSSSSITSSPSIRKAPMTPQPSPRRRPLDSIEIAPVLSDAPNRYSPDMQAPGLELLGVTTQHENRAPRPDIVSVAPATPPWRRAGALLSANNPFDVATGAHEPQRQIGRLLNPLWVRNKRVESDVDGPACSGGLVQSHRMNILSGVGFFGNLRGRCDESTREHTHESHGRFHERHANDARHGCDRGLQGDGLQQATVVPMEEHRVPVQTHHEILPTKLDELAAQLAAIQETTLELKNSMPPEEVVTLRANLTSLEAVVAALRADMTTVQDDVSAANVDTGALRVDLTTLRTTYKADIADLKDKARAQAADLRGDLDRLRANLSTLTRNMESVTQDVGASKRECDGVRDQVSGLQRDFATLQENLARVDAVARKVPEVLRGLEGTIMQKMREEILQVSRDHVAERSSSLGVKRKRDDDEALSPSSGGGTSSAPAPESRVSKRLRTVVDFAAVGVLGAFGAYISLAYLQL